MDKRGLLVLAIISLMVIISGCYECVSDSDCDPIDPVYGYRCNAAPFSSDISATIIQFWLVNTCNEYEGACQRVEHTKLVAYCKVPCTYKDPADYDNPLDAAKYTSANELCPNPNDIITANICGSGVKEYDINEQCDDGNRVNGDGCSSLCVVENCLDTDNVNYGTSGMVTVKSGSNAGNYADSCSGRTLTEYVCGDETDNLGSNILDCATTASGACANGACKIGKSVNAESACNGSSCGNCADSDGANYLTYAELIQVGEGTYGDTCQNGLLQEVVCENDHVAFNLIDCSSIASGSTCAYGACVTKPTTCGNGVLDAGEECDDENSVDNDLCGNDCLENVMPAVPVCGGCVLGNLPKVHPENYGNNYFVPGTYNISVGDGFGKGDILIKFVEFRNETIGESLAGIYFEVFKKESDENYYHYPTMEKRIAQGSFNQLFDIVIEPSKYSVNSLENELIYHPSCNVYYDYCYDENSDYYAYNITQWCVWRCPFVPLGNEEIQIKKDKFSVVFPEGYFSLANSTIQILEKCYPKVNSFLGYDPEKPRIGIKARLDWDGYGSLTGYDEYLFASFPAEYWDNVISEYRDNSRSEEMEIATCSFLSMSHEFTHANTKELLGENYGLNEGLADFVEINFEGGGINCLDEGWSFQTGGGDIYSYANLSSSLGNEGSLPPRYYYRTGYCFWMDLTKEYGYHKFVEIMQELYRQSRNIRDYYVLDVIEEVIGEPFSEEILTRYSLTRNATFVEICNNCEMFVT